MAQVIIKPKTKKDNYGASIPRTKGSTSGDFRNEKWCNRFNALLYDKELTGVEAAFMLDTSESAVSAYCCGKRRPGMDMIIRICRVFHVTADWFLGLEDESK